MDKQEWIVSIPDQHGFEWFESRDEAEAFAVEAMTEILHDTGEAIDGQAFVAVIVSHVCEVADEETTEDRAEWLRERGLDYFVSGYRAHESAFMAKMAEERAEAVQPEVERLRARVAELEGAIPLDWLKYDRAWAAEVIDVLTEHAEDCDQQPAHKARPGRVGACTWCKLLERYQRASAAGGERS